MELKQIRKTEDEIGVVAEFEHKGKQGTFGYLLLGSEAGIDFIDYDEPDEEDIYEIVHNWVKKNIKVTVKIKHKNKLIKGR